MINILTQLLIIGITYTFGGWMLIKMIKIAVERGDVLMTPSNVLFAGAVLFLITAILGVTFNILASILTSAN